MIIRLATTKDIKEITEIYNIARRFMIESGNPTQWSNGYPDQKTITTDINNNNCYICIEENNIVGVFSFIIGADPTYQTIENGNWHSTQQYGTIHRLASNHQQKGISKACFDYCTNQMPYIRIDTHANNLPMQRALKKYGFKECGTIYVSDKTPRIAYDYIKTSN